MKNPPELPCSSTRRAVTPVTCRTKCHCVRCSEPSGFAVRSFGWLRRQRDAQVEADAWMSLRLKGQERLFWKITTLQGAEGTWRLPGLAHRDGFSVQWRQWDSLINLEGIRFRRKSGVCGCQPKASGTRALLASVQTPAANPHGKGNFWPQQRSREKC